MIERIPPFLAGRCSADFRAAVGDELLASFDEERGVVYALDSSLVLKFVNRAWS